MIKEALVLLLFFYFLTLFQTSFLVHFDILGMVPNLVLIAIAAINLFAPYYQWWGAGSAFIGGLYLDIFSLNFFGFFGFYVLISLAIFLLIKFILRKHVQFPEIKKF